MQVPVTLPDGFALEDLETAGDIANELRLAAAVKWFEQGRLSQGRAAEVAGLSRAGFLEALARYEVSPFQLSPEDIAEEMDHE